MQFPNAPRNSPDIPHLHLCLDPKMSQAGMSLINANGEGAQGGNGGSSGEIKPQPGDPGRLC